VVCLLLKRKTDLHISKCKYSFALIEDDDKLRTSVWKKNNQWGTVMLDSKIYSNTQKML